MVKMADPTVLLMLLVFCSLTNGFPSNPNDTKNATLNGDDVFNNLTTITFQDARNLLSTSYDDVLVRLQEFQFQMQNTTTTHKPYMPVMDYLMHTAWISGTYDIINAVMMVILGGMVIAGILAGLRCFFRKAQKLSPCAQQQQPALRGAASGAPALTNSETIPLASSPDSGMSVV